jgi:LPXTG-motif cell wall-anchored protein
MIQQAGRKVLEGMREWPQAAGGARRRMRELGEAAAALPRRLRARPSAESPSRWAGSLRGAGIRPGPAVLLVAGLALAIAGLLLYLRKRRQVAAHYTMGAGGAAPEGGPSHAFRGAETALPHG